MSMTRILRFAAVLLCVIIAVTGSLTAATYATGSAETDFTERVAFYRADNNTPGGLQNSAAPGESRLDAAERTVTVRQSALKDAPSASPSDAHVSTVRLLRRTVFSAYCDDDSVPG